MTAVSISGLAKSFGQRPVLAGVDLEIADGELVAVLGPSGSGKTTLLRILAGFERPDAGTVTVRGKTVEGPATHVPAEARGIGYVPQEGALFPHLDAAANVGFGLARRERRGPRVSELLDLVGLSGSGQLYPHQLSGGQQQRVALARALAVEPSVVLLDEPFSSLDAGLRAELRADVARALAGTATTAVLVTHDQDEALSLAHRVAVLRDGRVAQFAAPEDLYTRPVGPAVASFVGDANILEGTVVGGGVRTLLGVLALRAPFPGEGGPGGDGGPHATGQVTVLVRPEQLRLSGAGDAAARADGLAGNGRAPIGRVARCQYYGHDMLVTVEIGTAGGVRTVQARLAGSSPLAAGHAVSVEVEGPVQVWAAGEG